ANRARDQGAPSRSGKILRAAGKSAAMSGDARPRDPARRYFLDVRQSASGRAWEHRLSPAQENAAIAMAQSQGISDLVARIIAARGVAAENAARFLQPTIRELLPDPLTLT